MAVDERLTSISSGMSSSDDGLASFSTRPTTPEWSPQFSSYRDEPSIESQFSGLSTTNSNDLSHVRAWQALPDPTDARTAAGQAVKNICYIGAGYVGAPSAAVTALNNPSVNVTVCDRDEFRIKRWNSAHLPIHEPGLHDVVRVPRDGLSAPSVPKSGALQTQNKDAGQAQNTGRGPNLVFTIDCAKAVREADLIFLAVNTSTKMVGAGAGFATDMTALEGAVRMIAAHAKDGAIIVEKSTVPCRTARLIHNIFDALRPGAGFEVLSNPEFLSEGQAIENLKRPDRILIGCDQTLRGRRAAAALVKVYAHWVPRNRILCTNVWSSELSKLVANAMLAQRISSINSVSEICERTGADVHEVAKAIGLDQRIGPQFLKAGLGFGGSCFRKDIASLVYLARSLGLDDVANYWNQVNLINESQRNRFARNVVTRLNTTLFNKKVVLLGFAFKKNTGDPRESLAVDVIKVLRDEMPTEIAIFDPGCNPASIQKEVDQIYVKGDGYSREVVKTYTDAYAACQDADAIMIITDWDLFKNAPAKGTFKPAKSLPAPDPAAIAGLAKLPPPAVASYESSAPHPTQFVEEPACPNGCPECLTPTVDVDFNTDERLDWERVGSHMKEPRWVFDGRAVLNIATMEKLGFRVEALGVSSSSSAFF